MSRTRDTALIGDLLGHPTEAEWLEFNRNRCEPGQLGEYLSALADLS